MWPMPWLPHPGRRVPTFQDIAAVVGTALVLSSFVFLTALAIAALGRILGVRSMSEHRANPETACMLMLVLPLVTIVGTPMLRQDHGRGQLAAHAEATGSFMMLRQLVALQVPFALLGLMVPKRQGYAQTFLFGDRTSAGSCAPVCPGVAFSALVQFWVNEGLVGAGLIAKFGLAHWALTTPAPLAQVAMVWLVWYLNRRHLGTPPRGGLSICARTGGTRRRPPCSAP